MQYQVGDVLLMYRDSIVHKSKLNYEFMRSYEFVSLTSKDLYKMRWLGKNAINNANSQ